MSTFPNLRTNQASSLHEDSFWPSFTDMMMVIAMIFLIVSSILILRNFELLDNLKIVAEAERIAKEQALEKLKENETLIVALQSEHQGRLTAEAERQRIADEKALAEMEKARLSEEQAALKTDMLSLAGQNEALSEKIDALLARLNRYRHQAIKAAQQKQILTQELHTLSERNESLSQEFDQSMETQKSLQENLSSLEAKLTEKDVQIEALNTDKLRMGNALTHSQEEYKVLKVKYDKLIRPARSPAKKQVARVTYLQEGRYRLQHPTGQINTLGNTGLHEQLKALKEKHGLGLYVKIIIPENVNISHSQAWRFTNELLQKYDYYYQKSEENE